MSNSETFSTLQDFIQKRMRMSHIYQPLMLLELLQSGGKCPEAQIAKTILGYDASQIEYYTTITNNMVGKVLRNHGIVARDNKTKTYAVDGFEHLKKKEIAALIGLCHQKLAEFLQARGSQIFSHRKKSAGYISGTLRFEVFKRARFRCELCGISAEGKALEADHIVPRNKDGSDDISNLQALCYSCNAMKRDRDDTDFRAVKESYAKREKGCLFCETRRKRVVAENELAYVIRDRFPVTPLHTLIIPKRHATSYFDLGQAEVNACNQLLLAAKEIIQQEDAAVSGFNIGVNNGKSAGQTVFHCHIHLIPRRDNDVENPSGGVRHTISGKGHY